MPEQSSRGERGLRKDAEPRSVRGGAPNPSSLPRRSTPEPAGPTSALRPPLPRDADALPELEPAFWSVIDAGLPRLGVGLTAGVRAAIEAQAKLLLAWNDSINLTALRSAEQIARGHVLDSLAAVPLLRRLGSRRLLDVGSGAGYPGLPVALAVPAEECALVDSVRKKHSFLEVAGESAASALRAHGESAPSIRALAERAEDLAEEPDQREGWDIVAARAVGPVAEVVELALPLLRMGGHVVAWKRRPPDGSLEREVEAARRVLQAAGGGRPSVEASPAMAAVGLEFHALVVVRKIRPTPDRYPRPPAERRRALLP